MRLFERHISKKRVSPMIKCLAPWHSILVRFNGDIVPDGVYRKRYGNVLESPLNLSLIHI